MLTIKPSSLIRNKYNDVSLFCNTHNEPVFITKNGKGDLVVLSMEAYERLQGKYELLALLNRALEAENSGRLRPFSDSMKDIRKGLHDIVSNNDK